MKITFIANACCIYESKGYEILADPWLTDGAFEGSWFHYPPLKTEPDDLIDVDALYISHIHPDHYDEATLDAFRTDIPIVILDDGKGYLRRKLQNRGFENLIHLKDTETHRLGPFELTMYGPFCKHPFHESELGNLVDSALLLDDGETTCLNTNDNTPSLQAAKQLREKHGKMTLVQLNYNCAGPYPSCFELGEEKSGSESDRMITRNLNHMAAVATILEPKWVMPFAGQYVIGGMEWEKNKCLGTTTPDTAATRLALSGHRPLPLNELQSFDLTTGERFAEYIPIDVKAQNEYIERTLSHCSYPYEAAMKPPKDWIWNALPKAADNVRRKQKELNCYPDTRVLFRLGLQTFIMCLSKEPFPRGTIECRMDSRLLGMILKREAHWNNAEIGCHIDFKREGPYLPDAHMLMSYFHL